MRIAINGLALSRSTTGLGRATLHTLRALLRLDSKSEYVLVLPRDADEQLAVEAPNLAALEIDLSLAAPLDQLVGGKLELPRQLTDVAFDLCYTPSHLLPPLGLACPEVVGVHDLRWKAPPHKGNIFFRAYVNRSLPAVLKRAARLVCLSEATRDDLLELQPDVARERIEVIRLGVDPERFHPGAAAPPTDAPYIAVVGNQEPRRSVRTLWEALPRFRARMRPCRLVVVGPDETPAPRPASVDFVGYPEDCELASLYGGALMVVQPALYEGFGLPMLEAMACGVPVVCADAPLLRELGGDAAYYFAPRSAEAIAKTMEEVARNTEVRDELVRRGLARAAGFTWERTGRELLALFQEVVA